MINNAIEFTNNNDEPQYETFKFPINMEKLGKPAYVDEEPMMDKKKKTSKSKNKTLSVELADGEFDSNLPQYQSTNPYIETYKETNNMLRNSVVQIDILQNEVKSDLDLIRSSKTLKKKYDYIAQLSSTMGTLVGTKVTAIREMNKTITDSHSLDMKRVKELKMDANEIDDNKSIMDMYNAFISAPVGVGGFSNVPTIAPPLQDMTLTSGISNIVRSEIGNDSAYENYINNMTPVTNMMLLESNPNIKTVVVYDANSGNRWFDVQDITTGQSIPNTSKPDPLFLEDTTLDTRNMIARNVNLDTTYPLVVINNSSNILTEY